MSGIKLKGLQVQSFTAATAADLATAIQTWIRAGALERTLLEVVYQADGTNHHALLFYTE